MAVAIAERGDAAAITLGCSGTTSVPTCRGHAEDVGADFFCPRRTFANAIEHPNVKPYIPARSGHHRFRQCSHLGRVIGSSRAR